MTLAPLQASTTAPSPDALWGNYPSTQMALTQLACDTLADTTATGIFFLTSTLNTFLWTHLAANNAYFSKVPVMGCAALLCMYSSRHTLSHGREGGSQKSVLPLLVSTTRKVAAIVCSRFFFSSLLLSDLKLTLPLCVAVRVFSAWQKIYWPSARTNATYTTLCYLENLQAEDTEWEFFLRKVERWDVETYLALRPIVLCCIFRFGTDPSLSPLLSQQKPLQSYVQELSPNNFQKLLHVYRKNPVTSREQEIQRLAIQLIPPSCKPFDITIHFWIGDKPRLSACEKISAQAKECARSVCLFFRGLVTLQWAHL